MTTKGDLIGEGRTAEVFAWGDHRVVKLYRAEFPDDWARREACNAAVVGTLCRFAPATDGIVEFEDEGRPRIGIIYERVTGPTMLDVIRRQPWRLAALARQFARLHAALHDLRDPALAGLPSQVEQACWDIRHSAVSEAVRTRVLDALDRRPPGDSLCHRDFHLNQVVLTERGPVVLDWLTAGIGNPVSDVARTSLMISVPSRLPPNYSLASRIFIPLLRAAMHRLYLRDYRQARPLDAEELDTWRSILAVGRLNEHIPGEEPHLRRIIADAFGHE